jgi:hypothetical protein
MSTAVTASSACLIGMPFLRRRKSSLIDGAADDAAEQTQSRRIGPQVGRKVMWFDSVTLSDVRGRGERSPSRRSVRPRTISRCARSKRRTG